MLSHPPLLKEKATIGIVSPGRFGERADIEALTVFLAKHGMDVVVHPQNFLREGQLAGSDAARAEALMDMFSDRTIDAIICARGGTAGFRVLDRLDYEIIRANPKPFVGFSDVTVLLHAIAMKAGFATYHGPMALNFSMPDHDRQTGADLIHALRETEISYRFPGGRVLRGGAAEGMLTGGNLALLQTLIGTPYDWACDNAILFLEDEKEPLYKIDRMLGHLRMAGKLTGVKGVLMSEFTDMTDDPDVPYGKDLAQIVLDHFDQDVPIVMDLPLGHGNYIATLPIGARAYLTVSPHGTELALMT